MELLNVLQFSYSHYILIKLFHIWSVMLAPVSSWHTLINLSLSDSLPSGIRHSIQHVLFLPQNWFQELWFLLVGNAV